MIGLDGARTNIPEEYMALRGLWASVLMCACEDFVGVSCLSGYKAAAGKQLRMILRDEARSWMDSSDVQVGSFLWICGMLGLDAQVVRQRMEDGQYRKHMGGRWREKYRGVRA